MPDRSARRVCALVLGLAVLAHAPALWGGFVYDDFNDVVRNPSAQAGQFFQRLPQMARPLLKASYALQDALHGPNPFGFHAVNLALHLVATALVLALVRRAATLAGTPELAALRLAALTAALWAVHPASAETVSYVSGRSAGLSGVLSLAALWAATGPRPWPVAAFLSAALAPLARETALIVPLLLLAWQLCLPAPGGLRRAVPVWLGALAAALLLAALPRHQDLVAFSLTLRDPADALRGNLFAVTEMLRLWFQPWRISAVPAQPVIYGWTDLPTLLRLAALAGAALAALRLRRRAPLVALAVLWTLLALAPANSLIWRLDPVAVRPLYLAGIGLALLVACALVRVRAGPVLGAMLAAALALGLAAMTFQRAGLYADAVALFADAAAKTPGEARPLVLLGLVQANAGDAAAARATLRRALALDPANAEARNALRLLEAGPPIYSPLTP
ncbi:hypothetical protein LHP98_14225 [Rhodobacter sp. Har01]|uniref:hypothetical protein n=1 Tax=Rhodobacter sp. Har01 TaxID=2883999 RepID=UPI001D095C06|nr:hypothetical protein [Rhodobacter sp. Har01]MCB6179277.1 hypothetical protein [Rhodobacter sp. Har01]